MEPQPSLVRNGIFGGLLPSTDIARWIALATRRGVRGQMLAAVALAMLLSALLGLCFRAVQRDVGSVGWAHPIGRLAQEWLPKYSAEEALALEPNSAPLVGEPAAVRNANTPMMALGPSAAPFHFSGPLPDRMRARTCLAAAMLFEAGDDGAGQLAVGQVVLNRMRHPAFPGSVCGVVLEGSQRATGCQFTFTCDGALARGTSVDARARALLRADMMLAGLVFAPVGLATHYHTTDVYPWWSPKLEKIARQGAHLFFRWPGYWGSARAVVDRVELEPSSSLFARFDPARERDSHLPNVADAGAAVAFEAPALARSATVTDYAAVKGAAMPMPLVPPSRRLVHPAPSETSGSTASITTPALLGNRLLRSFPDQGVFFLQISSDSSDGTRRRVAELLCGGRADCRVYGWLDPSAAPPTIQVGPDAKVKPTFLFVKKPPASGRTSPPPVNAF